MTFEQRMARNQLPAPSPSPIENLNQVVAILHPPSQEHPLANTERLLNRADQLDAQMKELQQRSSP
jgi:hypothetical protein